MASTLGATASRTNPSPNFVLRSLTEGFLRKKFQEVLPRSDVMIVSKETKSYLQIVLKNTKKLQYN